MDPTLKHNYPAGYCVEMIENQMIYIIVIYIHKLIETLKSLSSVNSRLHSGYPWVTPKTPFVQVPPHLLNPQENVKGLWHHFCSV